MVSRQELSDCLADDLDDHALEVAMSRLRRTLNVPGLITTVVNADTASTPHAWPEPPGVRARSEQDPYAETAIGRSPSASHGDRGPRRLISSTTIAVIKPMTPVITQSMTVSVRVNSSGLSAT